MECGYVLALVLCLNIAHSGASTSAFGGVELSKYLDELYEEIAAELAEQAPQTKFGEAWVTPSRTAADDEPLAYKYLPTVMDSAPKWVKARRPEEEDQVVSSGYQHMSGGAGEGKQHLKPEGSVNNIQEVKTDAELPSYCSPPNPCPKGKTATDGCQENIPDTADFNRNYILRQMEAGVCGCDYEHMYQDICPQQLDATDNYELPEFDQMLDEILEEELGEKMANPYLSDGEKRKSMTAKKGGQRAIRKRSVSEDMKSQLNPYLQGAKLPVVAKKSPHME